MGEVTAFLSHSWNDEEEAPGAKHALVSRWARRRHRIARNLLASRLHNALSSRRSSRRSTST